MPMSKSENASLIHLKDPLKVELPWLNFKKEISSKVEQGRVQLVDMIAKIKTGITFRIFIAQIPFKYCQKDNEKHILII